MSSMFRMFFLFLISIIKHSQSTAIKTAVLTPLKLSDNGATVMFNFHEVSIDDALFKVGIIYQNSWQFIIKADETFDIDTKYDSTIKFTVDIPMAFTGQLLFAFTTDNEQYISMSIPMDDSGRPNMIYPACSISSTSITGIGDIASIPRTDRFCEIAGGACSNWKRILPSNAEMPVQTPLTFTIKNDIIKDEIIIFFHSHSFGPNFIQACKFDPDFFSGKGLKIYIAGDKFGESYIIQSFNITSVVERPTTSPTYAPTSIPTIRTTAPTKYPTIQPTTLYPTGNPTIQPTDSPVTPNPTIQPTHSPVTSNPTTVYPTANPFITPTDYPSPNPTVLTATPTVITQSPFRKPTLSPSPYLTKKPFKNPSDIQMVEPSINPSENPSDIQMVEPSINPSENPSDIPSIKPLINPSEKPSESVNLNNVSPTNDHLRSPTISPSVPTLYIQKVHEGESAEFQHFAWHHSEYWVTVITVVVAVSVCWLVGLLVFCIKRVQRKYEDQERVLLNLNANHHKIQNVE